MWAGEVMRSLLPSFLFSAGVAMRYQRKRFAASRIQAGWRGRRDRRLAAAIRGWGPSREAWRSLWLARKAVGEMRARLGEMVEENKAVRGVGAR